MNVEAWIALAGLGITLLSAAAAFIGSSAAVKVHLNYMRRDLDDARRSVRAAHWRLDEVGAPPAPTVSR